MLLVVILAISLSMDAFSLSICFGTLNLKYNKIFILSIIVGIFHFVMPIIGMNIAHLMLHFIKFDPKYIAFVVFLALGLFMIFDKEGENLGKLSNTLSLFVFGFVVSIDSLVAGIGLNMIYHNHIISAITFSIFSATFTLLGLLLGKYISTKLGSISKKIGGLVLILLSIYYIT